MGQTTHVDHTTKWLHLNVQLEDVYTM